MTNLDTAATTAAPGATGMEITRAGRGAWAIGGGRWLTGWGRLRAIALLDDTGPGSGPTRTRPVAS